MEAATATIPPAKKRPTVFGQAARRKRIFAPPGEGPAEIARETRLKTSEAHERREVDETHAHPQLCRPAPALKVAGKAVADVIAIPPLMKGARPARVTARRMDGSSLARCRQYARKLRRERRTRLNPAVKANEKRSSSAGARELQSARK